MSTYIKLTQNAHWMPRHPAGQFNNWHSKLPQLNLLWALTGELKPETFIRYAVEWNDICKLCAADFKGEALAINLAGCDPQQASLVLDAAFASGIHSNLQVRLRHNLAKLSEANAKS